MKVLRRGSRGFEVEFLQGLLNKASAREGAHGVPLGIDDDFGALTDAALRAFQGRHQPLAVDGVAGNQS